MHEDAEVQMIAARKAGCTGKSDVSLYRSADARLDFTHMGVEGLQTKPVVDDDEIAENTEAPQNDASFLCRWSARNRRVGHEARSCPMRLFVDFRPIVHIRALIAKDALEAEPGRR